MEFGPRRRPCSSIGPRPMLFSELVARRTIWPDGRRSKYMSRGLEIERRGHFSRLAWGVRHGFGSRTAAAPRAGADVPRLVDRAHLQRVPALLHLEGRRRLAGLELLRVQLALELRAGLVGL